MKSEFNNHLLIGYLLLLQSGAKLNKNPLLDVNRRKLFNHGTKKIC